MSRLIPAAGLAAVLAVALASAEEPFRPPEYTVYRVAKPPKIDGKLDEPDWQAAPTTTAFHFPWWKAGEKEQTTVKVLWDDDTLYVACVCRDAHITARHTERDGKIYEDDCFEIMVAPNPEKPEVYFNLEWNVLGGLLDNFRPDGPKKPRAPKWDAEGVQPAGTYQGTLNDDTDTDTSWTSEVAIPLKNFALAGGPLPPKPGTVWRANFNRQGGTTNPQSSQWSPGDTPAPNFHTPHRFGKLIFSDKPPPAR
ncbi:MAG: carbohydrate-binding family 9-like protein [Gemmataceae bacterium]|nr:carbohydrate-binding family 9-like protein [Gemmataceae bacterium]